MSDDEIERFMELFRVYRTQGTLPKEEHKEFKQLFKRFLEKFGGSEVQNERRPWSC